MDPDVANWAATLLPERVDPALRLPADTLLLYQALSWSRPLSAHGSCHARQVWSTGASTVGYETEQGIASWAERDGEILARMLIVVRHSRAEVTDGESLLPEPPEVPSQETNDPCVLVEAEVQDFVTSVDGRYPVASDATFARSHGHASVIIPGTLLMVRSARAALVMPRGTVEMWFRHPVPVGAVLMRRRSHDAAIESFHLAGRGEPSALLRICPEAVDELPPPSVPGGGRSEIPA